MKRILLIMPYGSVGGMERLALNFYNYFKKKGHEVKAIKFIGLSSDIITFENDEIILSQKDFYELSDLERLSFYLTAPVKIRKIIKEHRITHSISFGDMANIFSALTFTKEFKIGSIHALKSVELSTGSAFSKLVKLSYKSVYKNFDKLVCISSAIKNDLLENCGYRFEDNLEVIYNPHDIPNITELSKEPLTDENEKKTFEKDVILFLGRISYQKSPWHLVNAFSKIENPNTILVFIGDGDNHIMEYLKRQIDFYGIGERILFLGRKANPYKYLKRSKLLALSSNYEGTPNVIVESIALKTPVVSTNCTGGIGELMSIDSISPSSNNIIVESGIITPNLFDGEHDLPKEIDYSNEKINLLTNAMEEVLEKPYFKESIIKNFDKLTSKFNLKYVCEEYLKPLNK